MTQQYWRMPPPPTEESQNDGSQGASSRSQLSVTTRKEHLDTDNNCSHHRQPKESPMQRNVKAQKKDFLKKGSRKFLACSGDANTHRDKENISVVVPPANRSKSIGKEPTNIREQKLPNIRRERSKTPEKQLQQQECPTPTKHAPQQSSTKPIQCIPPQLFISRLTATVVSRQQTASVVRSVFNDGRISLYFKDIDVSEQYLHTTVLTQWSNGDWKLHHNGQTIYRLEQLDRYEIAGKLL